MKNIYFRSITYLGNLYAYIFMSIDAYVTAKKLFEKAKYRVPTLEISTHNGNDIR